MGAKQQVGSVYVLQVVLASYDGFSGICNSLAMHLFVQVTKKLILACTLAFLFMLFECVGGYMANSVAILSDAAHMFSDVFSFLVSIYCMRLIKMKASAAYSFGYHRAETIGALVSVLIVCVITGGLVMEAIQRLIHPTDIDGRLMFIVATTGIGFNILLLVTLGHDHHHHLGGSCGHDHGHDHGHSHGAADSHGHCNVHGHCSAGPCNHGHVRADSDGPGAHGRRALHADQKACDAQLQDVADLDAGSGNEPCTQDQEQEHAHDPPSSSAASAFECLSVENTSLSHQGLVQVQLEASGVSGHIENVCLASVPRRRSHGRRGVSCHSHDVSHDHSHGNGGHHEDHHNQNLRGAIVHVIGDILQSIGVAVAGAIIWYTDADPKWLWVDPACTFIFAISVVWVTKTLIFDIIKDLMEAAPTDVNVDNLVNQVVAVSGVIGVHDLHVWRIGTGKVILTAHIDVQDKSDPYAIIEFVEDVISAAGISHSTVQICSGKIEACQG